MDGGTATTASAQADELARFHELLDPLARLSQDGSARLPEDENGAWEAATGALVAGVDDPVEAEETIATFARVLWSAPAWSEPAANIATALLARVINWREPSRRDGLELARVFAERALALDPGSTPARAAIARVAVATGDVMAAEKAAARLPGGEAVTLSVRSEIRAARGDLRQAIDLRETQLASEKRPAELRAARLHLADLLQADGQLDRAIANYRAVVALNPDFAPARLALAKLLRQTGHRLEALAEAESAQLLGSDDGQALVAETAAELDRDSFEWFRELLLTARDGDTMSWCPDVATAT